MDFLYFRPKSSEWHKEFFRGVKKPTSLQTIERWIDKGKISGRKIGTMRYVYCYENYEPLSDAHWKELQETLQSNVSSSSRVVKVSTGNAIADAILKRKLVS